MWLRTRCEVDFEIDTPTAFILMLRPRSRVDQWVAREAYTLDPSVPAEEFPDAYGNLAQRLIAEPGPFHIRTSADVMVAEALDEAPGAPFVEVQELPESILPYLLPSRYCESDRFMDMAPDVVGDAAPGYDQVARIDRWIHERFRFNPESPYFQQSAVEMNENGEGVCREFAHLGMALCRALSIPARMVVGYLHGLEPMDFHAWFEAYVGDRWYTFDPTQGDRRGGRVTVAYGRDAADVAMFNQFGPPVAPNRLEVEVEELPGPPTLP